MAGLSVGCGKKKSEKSGSDYGFQAGIINSPWEMLGAEAEHAGAGIGVNFD